MLKLFSSIVGFGAGVWLLMPFLGWNTVWIALAVWGFMGITMGIAKGFK